MPDGANRAEQEESATMENKLKQLFDYQRFENSPRLEKLIQETQLRQAQALSDDDLAFLAAAGELPPAEQPTRLPPK